MHLLRFLKLILLLSIFIAIQSIWSKPPDQKWITAKGGLILRASPDRAGKQVALMPYGSNVIVLSKSSKTETIDGKQSPWFNVQFGLLTGWAFGSFLQDTSLPEIDFQWNKDSSLYFILKNNTGTAADCGNGYSESECEVTIFRGNEKIYHSKINANFNWRNNREIISSNGLAECSGGEFEYIAYDVFTQKNTATYSFGFTNPSCGEPEGKPATIYYSLCSNNRCATIVKKENDIIVFPGKADFSSDTNDPVSKLKIIGRIQSKEDLKPEPDFENLRFKVGNDTYEINYEAGKILRR